MRYLLDANIFIQAYRFHYPFDVFPAFWNWLEKENENNSIATIDGVYNEIKAGADELAEWMKSLNSAQWFLKCDDENTQEQYVEIVNLVMGNRQYKQSAKEEFLGVADPWLIAKAKAEGLTIVTQEKSAPLSKRKIYIPDICREYGIPCISTINLIRTLGGRF